MKVKIEFFRKCMYCLYETPNSKTLTWENNVKVDQNEDIKFSEEDIAIMLNQLHAINGIGCENCGQNDKLGYAIVIVNDKPFIDVDAENEDDDFMDDTDGRTEFSVHHDILEYRKTGYIIFHLKDGSSKIGQVEGIITSHSDGAKRYSTKVYHEIDKSSDEEFEFDPDDDYFFSEIHLKDLRDVEYYTDYISY